MANSTNNLPGPGDGKSALIKNFPNGVLVLFDDDFRYRIVGPDVLPFSKRKARDMVGHTVDELFPKETVDRLVPEFQATVDGDARSFDVEYDDRIHHIETKPARIDGQPYGILVTQDVTEERLMAKELERQNERLDQFASMLSHDLRNPLSIAAGKLAMYRESGDDSHLDDLERAIKRIDDLSQDLLTLARSDGPPDVLSDVSVSTVAHDAWAMIDTRSATLETERTIVEADSGQLQALFENLFRNAIGHGGADVTIRVGPIDDGFFVEDTGQGIPEEDHDRVFEHGFSTGYGGNGVGLTIVNQIAKRHNWNVVLSESEEGGARFEFEGVATGVPKPSR